MLGLYESTIVYSTFHALRKDMTALISTNHALICINPIKVAKQLVVDVNCGTNSIFSILLKSGQNAYEYKSEI